MPNKSSLHIIKVGGSVLDDMKRALVFYEEFIQLESPKILVHGGGQQANKWLKKLHIEPRKINGRRITDAQSMEVIKMVYASLNKEVVSNLNALGARAIGLCGCDASIIRAHKRVVQDIDYGFAGDIDIIDDETIDDLLNAQMDLIFSPLTFQPDGILLNTNADTIAAQLAIAMSQRYFVELQLISDVPGVLKDPAKPATRIEELNERTYKIFKNSGTITGGMIPKIDNALEGLRKGINSIVISNRIIQNHTKEIGTKITL